MPRLTVEVRRGLRLPPIHGSSLARLGVTAELASGGDYERPQLWSRALWEHSHRPGGILYRSRHDDPGLCATADIRNISASYCSLAIGCILKVREETNIVKFCVLASGSSGNAALLATENTRILVDAGLSMRELRKRLASIGESLENIDAILITHEHSDHVAGLPVLARNKDVRAVIYMTLLAAPAIDWGETPPARLEAFQAGASFQFGDIEVRSFGIPHDAIDPVGYCFEAQGVRVGVATDLGYVPESIKFHLRRTDLLLLEANHDLDMLKVGPYPWSVKQRVMSRVGHLSNLHMSDYLMQDLDSCTANLILGHLSEQNNHPAIVQMVATEALERRGLETRLSIAAQNTPSEVFQF